MGIGALDYFDIEIDFKHKPKWCIGDVRNRLVVEHEIDSS